MSRADETNLTIRDPSSAAAHVSAEAIVVRVTAGPDAGISLVVPADEAASPVVVGAAPSAALRLVHDRKVSRRHLAVSRAPGGIALVDLDSSNGTWVRGIRITNATVAPGEAIVVGDSTLVVAFEVSAPGPAAEIADGFGRMVGRSFEMRRLFALGARLAVSDVPVLVEGESGTGKELFAEEIHAQSARRDRRLVVVDAFADDRHGGAVTLFGAAPGILPEAPDGWPGLLEAAHGGTLLLDEPSELSPELQRRLAQALGRRKVQRVGSEDAAPFDARILATSSVALDPLVERGEFREDLYYSITGARVEIPPLRTRALDIAVLVEHFWSLARAAGTPPAALVARFSGQPWPGNVRELELAVARHLAIGDGDLAAGVVTAPASEAPSDDIITRILAQSLPLAVARQEVVEAFERRYVERILREHDGNVTRAARASGLAHRYFQTLKARRGF